MIMEAKKLCNLLSSSQRPRKASGVVQRPEWQRVHSVECSPVWRPENQDCRGQTVVPDLIHTGGRRSCQTSYTQGADGQCQTSYTQGAARPRTRRGQMVVPVLIHAGGRRSVPDLVTRGADGRARPRTRRRSRRLTSLPVVLCSGLTGLDDAHRHWRAFCFAESSNSHAGIFLSPARHSQK